MANALGGTMQLRLDKYLADLSVDTRSKVKLLIRKGRVRVNNEIAKKPETKISACFSINHLLKVSTAISVLLNHLLSLFIILLNTIC